MSERLVWVDICKGLGIILVVVAHVLLGSRADGAEGVARLIFLVHMPLFFLLAGMTLKPELPSVFARRKAAALLIPYLFFLGILALPALATTCGWGLTVPQLGIDRCSIMPVKLVLGGSSLGGVFGTFWFVPSLYFGLLLAQLVLQNRGHLGNRTRLCLLGVLAMLGYLLPKYIPFSTHILALGTAPMAAVFNVLGFWMVRVKLPGNWLSRAAILLGSALAIAFQAPFDMKFGIYGAPIVGLAGAVALSGLVMLLALAITKWPPAAAPLQMLGQRTLTILYLHQAVHLCLRLCGLDNDAVLIATSLGIPLLLHDPLMRFFEAASSASRLKLSPKSPAA